MVGPLKSIQQLKRVKNNNFSFPYPEQFFRLNSAPEQSKLKNPPAGQSSEGTVVLYEKS